MAMTAIITLITAGVLSLLVVWIVEGLFKKEPPFGMAVEFIAGLFAGLLVAALDYWVFVPWVFGADSKEWVRMLAAVAEGSASAWLILWILRQVKSSRLKTARK